MCGREARESVAGYTHVYNYCEHNLCKWVCITNMCAHTTCTIHLTLYMYIEKANTESCMSCEKTLLLTSIISFGS